MDIYERNDIKIQRSKFNGKFALRIQGFGRGAIKSPSLIPLSSRPLKYDWIEKK